MYEIGFDESGILIVTDKPDDELGELLPPPVVRPQFGDSFPLGRYDFIKTAQQRGVPLAGSGAVLGVKTVRALGQECFAIEMTWEFVKSRGYAHRVGVATV